MPLTTTAQVLTFLKVPAANAQMASWLDALRLAAEAEVKTYCGRDFEAKGYVDIYDGNGQRRLALRQTPVTAVNNVWLDYEAAYGTNPAGAFPPSSQLVAGVDYALELDRTPPWQSSPVSFSGNLIRLKWVWSEQGRTYYYGKLSNDIGPAFGVIKVDYTAGYPAGYIPADLQIAVAMLCSVWRRILPLGGWVIGETIGDYEYKLETLWHMKGQYPELGTLFALLNRYRDASF